ncbi:type IV toxin-antitoxin system AbiEi family antitoxin domain-containing protein [Nocardioides acrostichi]|uniref:Type IV toxin-antitoxin system AbiEi family antitoxin domain-containing protein n=1 Tax=Nocardioides acrostichi TaxID=2784339 RepID=A0A930Y688_9ACTN|nr:type IV toxin-antitoxin system AbiEi family antitoxin domain-containing protein [Nocardioides acrostichi]MBF4162080.1 type IV toxin-antitoxin system AbiEi family antitoxin domain-containing protein [Nocardioides acrostichi]
MIAHLANDLGVVLRRRMVAAGIGDRAIAQLKRRGELVPLRQGVYALTGAWERAGGADRHLMLASGVMGIYGDSVALSHLSAALHLGAPDWQIDTSHVHVTAFNAVGERTQALVHHHQGRLHVDDLTLRDGTWTTSPARTALDTAAMLPRDPAVALLDWFVASGHTTTDELLHFLQRRLHWSDHLHLAYWLSLVRPGAQSVGESRLHLLIGDAGLPAPELQIEVRTHRGALLGYVDQGWRDRGVLVEFDGMEKYHRFRRPGETIEGMVVREKLREDAIREATGCTLIRVIWRDLDDPASLVQRLRHALFRAA